jgi:hypothetical protein
LELLNKKLSKNSLELQKQTEDSNIEKKEKPNFFKIIFKRKNGKAEDVQKSSEEEIEQQKDVQVEQESIL